VGNRPACSGVAAPPLCEASGCVRRPRFWLSLYGLCCPAPHTSGGRDAASVVTKRRRSGGGHTPFVAAVLPL